MTIFEQIKKDIHLQINTFSLHSSQTRLAFQASAAVILAIFLAVLLQTQDPYWAGISAFISTQPTVGNTVSKSIERMIGTLIGAVSALIIVSLFLTQPAIFSIAIFLLAFIGIYFTSVIENKTYTWMFFYVTGIMILLAGLNNPTPSNFVDVAFFRSFEIIIGVLSGCIISLVFSSQHAHKQLTRSLNQLIRLLIDLNQKNQQYISIITQLKNEKNQQTRDKVLQEHHDIIKKIRSHQVKQDQLLLYAQHEIKSNTQHTNLVNVLTKIRDIASLLMDSTRHHYLGGEIKPLLEQETAKLALIQFQRVLSENLKEINVILENQQELAQAFATKGNQLTLLKERLNKTVNVIEQICFNQSTQEPSTTEQATTANAHTQLAQYEWLQSLRLIQNEINQIMPEHLIHEQEMVSAPLLQRNKQRYFHYDSYYFKHAIIGATAILFVPFIWLYFNLPGYYQIAVSIAVCFNLSSDTSRDKGLLRIMGCFIGSVMAIFILTLSLDSFPLMLAILFGTTFGFGLIHFSNTSSMSLGTQASVVVIIGIINQLTPNTSLIVPIERLGGIFLGVLSVIIFQAIFWPYQQKDKIKHTQALLTTCFNQHLDAIFSNEENQQSLNLWDKKGQYSLKNLKIHVSNFVNLEKNETNNTERNMMTNTQTSLHLYYSIFHYLMLKKDPHFAQFIESQNKNHTVIIDIYKLLAHPIVAAHQHNTAQEYSDAETKLTQILKHQLSLPQIKATQPTNAQLINPTSFYLALLCLCRYKRLYQLV